MRILFLESHPMWIHGLPNGFRDAGHEVFVSGPLTEDNLPQMVSDYKPDLIMTMGWGPENSSLKKQDLIRTYVGKTAIPHIYWATEDPTHTEYFTLPFLQRVQPDYVFTICPSKIDFYRQLGIKTAHLDFAYHPSVHYRSTPKETYKSKIVLVANAYPNKLRIHPNHYRHQSMKILIEPILKENIRIDFYGSNWDKMKPILGYEIPEDWIHGAIPYTEANQVYSSADIIIGLQNHLTQVTQRTFEIMGSGGLLLTNNTPEVNRLFNTGTDILVSKSPEETVELVQYYLKHPEHRKPIQESAKKAVEKHSYQQRAEYILKVLHSEGICKGKKQSFHIQQVKTDFIHDKWQLYTVCNGDTLWGISRAFGVPIQQIRTLNGLSSDYIEAGQLLKLKELTSLLPKTSSILISKGESGKKNIALTYDAGDGAEGAPMLLDVLKKHQVRTTFFLTGEWVEKYPDLARRIAHDGHEIGNHSYSHPDFTTITREEMMHELKKAEDIIGEITGKNSRPLFRPPYGAWCKEVLETVGKAGYPYSIYWSIDTIDWKHPLAEGMVKTVMNRANADDIVLMHLEYLHTAFATEMLIPKLIEAGFQIRPLSDLLKYNMVKD